MNRRAIVFGVLIYLGLYVLHLLVIPLFAQMFERTDPLSFLWVLNQVLGFATVGISGFIAGRIAAQRRLAHGFMVGALATLISALAAWLVSIYKGVDAPMPASVIAWMVTNGFLAAVAATLGQTVDQDKAKDKTRTMRF